MTRAFTSLAFLTAAVAIPGRSSSAQDHVVIRPRVSAAAPSSVERLPTAGACEWSDLVAFTWTGGDLAVQASLGGVARQMIRDGRQVLLKVAGAPRPYVATTVWERFAALPIEERKKFRLPPDGSVLTVTAVEAPDDAPPQFPRVREIRVDPDGTLISCRGMLGDELVQIDFTSHDGGVLLAVGSQSDPLSPSNFAIQADSAAALLAANEWEVRRYLSTALRPVAGTDVFLPGAGDVYEAFDSIAPLPEAQRSLDALLPKLGAADAGTRSAALRELQNAADGVVCAVVRQSREPLSAMQRAALDDFITSRSRRLHTGKRRSLREDRLFLIDCLEFADPRIRAAASEQLSAQLGRTVRLDVNDSLACAAEALRLRAEHLAQLKRTK